MASKKLIDELLERNRPMAMRRQKFVDDGITWDVCPRCGVIIVSDYARFCDRCGQAFDRENYMFE